MPPPTQAQAGVSRKLDLSTLAAVGSTTGARSGTAPPAGSSTSAVKSVATVAGALQEATSAEKKWYYQRRRKAKGQAKQPGANPTNIPKVHTPKPNKANIDGPNGGGVTITKTATKDTPRQVEKGQAEASHLPVIVATSTAGPSPRAQPNATSSPGPSVGTGKPAVTPAPATNPKRGKKKRNRRKEKKPVNQGAANATTVGTPAVYTPVVSAPGGGGGDLEGSDEPSDPSPDSDSDSDSGFGYVPRGTWGFCFECGENHEDPARMYLEGFRTSCGAGGGWR